MVAGLQCFVKHGRFRIQYQSCFQRYIVVVATLVVNLFLFCLSDIFLATNCFTQVPSMLCGCFSRNFINYTKAVSGLEQKCQKHQILLHRMEHTHFFFMFSYCRLAEASEANRDNCQVKSTSSTAAQRVASELSSTSDQRGRLSSRVESYHTILYVLYPIFNKTKC